MMPGTLKLFLPPGEIGLSFEGSPPVLFFIDQDSPLANKVKVGQSAQTMIVPGEFEMSDMSAEELHDALETYMDREGKVLVLTDGPPQMHGPSSTKVSRKSKQALPSALDPNAVYLETNSSDSNGKIWYIAGQAGTVDTVHSLFVKIVPNLRVPIVGGEELLSAVKVYDPHAKEAFLLTEAGIARVRKRRDEMNFDECSFCYTMGMFCGDCCGTYDLVRTIGPMGNVKRQNTCGILNTRFVQKITIQNSY